MTKETVRISIVDKTDKSIKAGRITLLGQPLVMIGIGIIAESNAMQWAGFVLSFLAVLVFAAKQVKTDSNLTVDQARKRLDEIEKRGL